MTFMLSSQLAQTAATSIAWEIAYVFNGVVKNCTAIVDILRANRPSTINAICLQEFKEGDTLSWQIRNLDGTQNCLIRRATIVVGPA